MKNVEYDDFYEYNDTDDSEKNTSSVIKSGSSFKVNTVSHDSSTLLLKNQSIVKLSNERPLVDEIINLNIQNQTLTNDIKNINEIMINKYENYENKINQLKETIKSLSNLNLKLKRKVNELEERSLIDVVTSKLGDLFTN